MKQKPEEPKQQNAFNLDTASDLDLALFLDRCGQEIMAWQLNRLNTLEAISKRKQKLAEVVTPPPV